MNMTRSSWIVLALLMILIVPPACAETAETVVDEWTVLFYLCGSDLESVYGYASGNLEEILEVRPAISLLPSIADARGRRINFRAFSRPKKVNVLLQTGGCRNWHDENLRIDISEKALQRWKYNFNEDILFSSDTELEDYLSFDEADTEFELMESLPLASMSAPETLSDFIQWGAKTCPANKYMLVLWDHGGGAKTGVFIDELFQGDVMYLYELQDALKNGGVQFETVLIDACLMANLETAYAIHEQAHWLVASEEVVPGKGTAVRRWLQELVANPEIDGERLGRIICDTTQIRYTNEGDKQARSILTWSVIDLTKIERVFNATERFFYVLDEAFQSYPEIARTYAEYILSAEEYGDGQQNMRDLSGVFYTHKTWATLDAKLRDEMLEALFEAIAYSVRGSGRSGARGLSFCYGPELSAEELDIYAQNIRAPYYLSYLDIVTPWTAPEWVRDQVGTYPDIDTIEELQLLAKRFRDSQGNPGISITNHFDNLRSIYYRLYKLDEQTRQVLYLGKRECMYDVSYSAKNSVTASWIANDIWKWPSIEGIPCTLDLVMDTIQEKTGNLEYLYNIPVQIGTKIYYLRCGCELSFLEESAAGDGKKTYEVYGVWEGYDENSEMMNRNVKELSWLAGQEYVILNPLDLKLPNGRTQYHASKSMKMYRSLEIEEITLPAGTYFLEYEVQDMFMRPFILDRIEMHWDGKKVKYPKRLIWHGEELLNRMK